MHEKKPHLNKFSRWNVLFYSLQAAGISWVISSSGMFMFNVVSHSSDIFRLDVTHALAWQDAFKCFLTLGTALHVLISMSHPGCWNTCQRTHMKNTQTHACTCAKYSQARCEAAGLRAILAISASALLGFALCSRVHHPPLHLVTVYLSVCLPVPAVSHLSSQLPSSSSHLLSSHILPLGLPLSTVNFKSWYWLSVVQVQCLEGVFFS